MAMAELDRIVDDYLRQLESALGSLPASQRAQIVAEISEHVSQARTGLPTQDEASIRALLERIGTPREIAASALTEGVPAAPHRDQRGRTELLAIGAVVLLIVIGVVVYLAQSGSSAVTVPNVIGSTQAAAQRAISDSGLQYSVAARPFGSEVSGRPGTVVAQFPPAGTVESSGSPVTLDVSGLTTAPSVTVPNVVGESVSSAFRQLRAKGLGGESGGGTCTRTGPCGIEGLVVVAEFPFAGKSAVIGSAVALDAQTTARARQLGVIDGTLAIAGRTPGLAQPVAGTVWITLLSSRADHVGPVHVALSGSFSRALPPGSYELSGTAPASSTHSAGMCTTRDVTVVAGNTTTVVLRCQPKA